MKCKKEGKLDVSHVVQSVVISTAEDFTLNSTNDVEGVSLEKQIKPKGDFFFNLEQEGNGIGIKI